MGELGLGQVSLLALLPKEREKKEASGILEMRKLETVTHRS